MTRTSVSTVGLLLAAGIASAAAGGQESRSAAAAQTLTQLMQERRVDAIAARDPQRPDRFVAALLIPGSQLLVIASVHPMPAAIDQRLAQQQYRDVYTDLHGSGVREGRLFVTDLQADGLRPTRDVNRPFDIVYRNGVDQTSYTGDWESQKLTEAQYKERFAKDDGEYTRLLTLLAAALRPPASD